MTEAFSPEHLIIAPVLIPLVAGALMLFYDDRQRWTKLAVSIASACALLLVAAELVSRSSVPGGNAVGVYLLGDWPTPMAIVLVRDRLSSLMVALVAVLALPALVYSAAGWQRRGQHFHSLFQFMLMGLNGAFLTGDLFNLFVFFEVMLAASYGLVLHGSGGVRVRAGLHYIAINLMASVLFLIGIALVYGTMGTLNMADLATQIATLSPADRPLFHTAALILGVAFLVKAGIWPLSFWLPKTYSAGAAPVAAMFAINTKVGIYVILRLSMLTLGAKAGASQGFGANVLVFAGLATICFGLLGVLATPSLARIASHLVVVSSGTVLAVIGFALTGGGTAMLSGALYYLVSSTIATSALFLLAEPLGRGEEDSEAPGAEAYGSDLPATAGDDEDEPGPGKTIPFTSAILGILFIACVLLLAGLPPLSGFIGKLAMLAGALNPAGFGRGAIEWPAWLFLALVLLSGFATLVALVRFGVRTFWSDEATPQRISAVEVSPLLVLIAVTVLMTVRAESVLHYTDAAARGLRVPFTYADAVLQTPRMGDQPEEHP